MAQDPRAKTNLQIQTQKAIRQNPNQEQTSQDEEIMEEIIPLPFSKAYEMAEKFAATRIGQFVMRRGDRLLKTIEITAEWSLPQDQMKEKLERPLPWLPFLMMIVGLRLARVWLSCAAIMIGNSPVSARDVVYFVQTRRRKLRSLRYRGSREIIRYENELATKRSAAAGQNRNPWMEQIKKIFSSAICRPGQHRETERRIIFHRGQMLDVSEQQAAKRPRSVTEKEEEEVEICGLTVSEMLNKYANDDSDDDSDFVPNPDEESHDDSVTSSASSSDNTNIEEEQSQDSASEEKLTKDQQSEKRKHRLSKDSGTSMNQSVELKENGNDETIAIPMPMIEIKQEIHSDTENIEKLKTPHDNGPSNGTENRETEVAFNFVLTPPGNEIIKENNLSHSTFSYSTFSTSSSSTSTNVNAENFKKDTTGHESAAPKRSEINSTLNATAVAVTEQIAPELSSPTTSLRNFEKSTFGDNNEHNVENIPSNRVNNSNNDNNNNFCYSSSSPTLSAASSTSSLESFIKNEVDLAQNERCSSSTPPSTPITDNDAHNDFESASLTSVSSSEDDFYSPIGSPPDFNAFQQRQVNFNFSNMEHSNQHNQASHFLNTHQPNHSNQHHPRRFGRYNHQGNGQQHQGQHQHQAIGQHQQANGQHQQGNGQHHQGNGPHPQQQRNRGHNRR